jgi:hypothetical protein
MRAYTGIDELDGDRFTASRGQAHIKDIDEGYG